MAQPTKNYPPGVSLASLAMSKGVEIKSVKDPAMIEQARNALKTSPIPDNSGHLASNGDIDYTWAELDVVDIEPYDGNPRKASNEQYVALKESIRQNLIFQTISVTRRPGQKRFMIYAGGNTRIKIMRELWEETGDTKFKSLKVVVRKWPGEAMVLLAHLAENNQRSDMTFWDNAQGMQTLKEKFEAEKGEKLSLRDFNQILDKNGYKTNIASLSSFNYAIQYLGSIGERISSKTARVIPPKINLYAKIAQVWREEGQEQQDAFLTSFIKTTIERFSERFNNDLTEESEDRSNIRPEELFEFIEMHLADYLSLEPSKLKKIIGYVEQYKQLSKQDIERLISERTAATKAGPIADTPSTESTSVDSELSSQTRRDLKDTHTNQHLDNEKTVPKSTESAQESIIGGGLTQNHRQDSFVASNHLKMQSSKPFLLDMAKELLAHFNLLHLIVLAEEMPHGFYLAIPETPLVGTSHAREAALAWGLIANLTKQLNATYCIEHLPEGNPWRELSQKDENSMGFELELAIEHHIGNAESLPISWLFGMNKHPAMKVFLDIIYNFSERQD